MSTPEPPMTLCLGEAPCGQILSYGYETPWASGRFAAKHAGEATIWIEISELLDELESWPDDESVAAEEQRWEAALAHRGITQADIDTYSRGAWTVEKPDGQKSWLISPPVFDRQGFVTFRW